MLREVVVGAGRIKGREAEKRKLRKDGESDTGEKKGKEKYGDEGSDKGDEILKMVRKMTQVKK